MMEGKRRMMAHDDEMRDIKKGPWKVEEDEVLINHVNKYGPRDWSSIRSKGLLRRTGKSCRLRWVNKLRPDLKTGVKFSAEEERTVIDLQAQFGNKWAKIATYLPGRTDNDVKNFWSSRQKRLARILQTSAPSSSTKSTKPPPPFHNLLPSLKAPNLLSLSTGEEFEAKPRLFPSAHTHTAEMVPPFRDLVYQNPATEDQTSSLRAEEQQQHISFSQFPLFQPDYPLLMESQDFLGRLGAPAFMEDGLGHPALGTAQVPIQVSGTAQSRGDDIDSLIEDDFPPIDLFDQIEQLPSPSHWS